MKVSILFLGSGGSLGVPVVGCVCAVCSSSSSFNRRLRPSLCVFYKEKKLVIDVGPDFREQALRYHLHQIDGVLLTHPHYDHIAGIDELRIYSFRQKHPVPCLLSAATLEELKLRYYYLIPSDINRSNLSAKLHFHLLEGDRGKILFEGIPIHYLSYFQRGMKVTGFRFGSFAYLTDLLDYSEHIFEDLQEVDTLVLSGQRFDLSTAHLSIEQAIAFSQRAGVSQTYLTHLSHEIDYEVENVSLPKGVSLAYDGLTFPIEVPM